LPDLKKPERFRGWQNAPVSGFQRIGVIVVAILAVVGGAVVALNLVGDGGTARASATATSDATASAAPSASVQPSASAQSEDDLLAALREIEQQVLEIRGLPAADIGPPDLIARAELPAELERIFDEQYPPEERERDQATLEALGLLEEGQDIVDLQLQLLGDQVLGFYDDATKRMVVVTDAGLDPEARMTYAHEYTHALQDAAFGLDSLETDAEGEDDRGLARTALLEGDASVAMLAWAVAHLTPQELLEITTTPVPDLTGIPSWMSAQLEFPYVDGLNWASVLVGNPLDPDFTAIDEAFASPPDSTEQIIDPDAWTRREPVVPVEGADLAASLGDGWTEVESATLGQAMVGIILAFHGVDQPTAADAAAGWGGDRLVVATGPDGAFALAWRTAWDSATDATEFADAYRGVVGSLDFPADVVELDGGDVLVVHGSTEELAQRAAEIAGG
jgi:hypothetical protein